MQFDLQRLECFGSFKKLKIRDNIEKGIGTKHSKPSPLLWNTPLSFHFGEKFPI